MYLLHFSLIPGKSMEYGNVPIHFLVIFKIFTKSGAFSAFFSDRLNKKDTDYNF